MFPAVPGSGAAGRGCERAVPPAEGFDQIVVGSGIQSADAVRPSPLAVSMRIGWNARAGAIRRPAQSRPAGAS